MQTVIGLAVSDASLLKAFAENQARALDLGADAGPTPPGTVGMWGLGFNAHGEMLVRKGPLSGLKPGSMSAHLRDVRARHVVLAAEVGGAHKKLEECSPLRYRDWLFAASGADSLGAGFAAKVQAELPTYAFSTKRHPGAEEAVMMLVMAALERANARDTRDLTTRAIQRALTNASAALRRLAEDEGAVKLLVVLHVAGHLFAFGLGRPVWLARFRGTGDAVRPGRLPRHEHLRVVLVGDRTDPEAAWEQVPVGLGVEIDASCEVAHFPA